VRLVADDRHVARVAGALAFQHRRVGGELVVHRQVGGGPLGDAIAVVGDADRQAHDHLWGGPGGGRRGQDGHDVLLDGAWPGQPGQGAVGQFPGDAQHCGPQCGDQHLRWRAARHVAGEPRRVRDHRLGP
jgi:hypothetical protein